MESIGAALGGVVHLRAGLTSVTAGVAVAHHGGFLQFVRAQQQVGGAGVVQVEIGVHLVVAVDGEQVRSRRQSESGEVSVAAAGRGIGRNARRGLGHVGHVVAGIRHQLDLLGVVRGGDVAILRLHDGRLSGDFHRLRTPRHSHL